MSTGMTLHSGCSEGRAWWGKSKGLAGMCLLSMALLLLLQGLCNLVQTGIQKFCRPLWAERGVAWVVPSTSELAAFVRDGLCPAHQGGWTSHLAWFPFADMPSRGKEAERGGTAPGSSWLFCRSFTFIIFIGYLSVINMPQNPDQLILFWLNHTFCS